MRTIPLLVLLAACGTDSDITTRNSETGDESGETGGAGQCSGTQVDVIGVYETRSDHSGADYHPTGTATVHVDSPGEHVLVLSSYEPTAWTVTTGDGASIKSVHLIGYSTQTVNLDAASVDTYEQGGAVACGYSYPYNGQGCDTDEMLAIAAERAGAAVTNFHGCYVATEWTLNADGSATSNCGVGGGGYEQNDKFFGCESGGGEGGEGFGDWQAQDFETTTPAACDGERFVRFDETYGLYVGAILCGSADSYKLYASDCTDGPFLEIADYAGHGQDHCELVNPSFTIPNEDDITSGGCTSCSVGDVVDINGPEVFARGQFGEQFERVVSRDWADLTNPQYSCGVSIP